MPLKRLRPRSPVRPSNPGKAHCVTSNSMKAELDRQQIDDEVGHLNETTGPQHTHTDRRERGANATTGPRHKRAHTHTQRRKTATPNERATDTPDTPSDPSKPPPPPPPPPPAKEQDRQKVEDEVGHLKQRPTRARRERDHRTPTHTQTHTHTHSWICVLTG